MDTMPSQGDATIWRRATGVILLGATVGSGLARPTFLARRCDGQIVQVSELLNSILDVAGPGRSTSEIADLVSEAYGRRLTVDGLEHVIGTKLAPLGFVVASGTTAPPPAPTAEPLLALRLRGTLLPAPVVQRIARLLAPLFFAPVVVASLIGLIVVDLTLLVTSSGGAALQQTLLTPELLLGLYAMLLAGAVIHELGHATACRYGGAEPGRIGVGLYLVFPAFFTNVTDSYRLGRAGRLRTDLGGLYFNVWCLLAAGIGYLVSGQGVLLLLVILMQLQMLQQLPPVIRLDGYYVLADLAGVPDLFAHIGPVIRSLPPWRPADPRVAELRPAARRIVTGWVVVVVPLLAGSFAWLLWSLPMIVRQTYLAIGSHARDLVSGVGSGHVVSAALSLLAIVLLALPLLGLVVVFGRLASSAATYVRNRRRLRAAQPHTVPGGAS